MNSYRQIGYESQEFQKIIERIKDLDHYRNSLDELKRLTSLDMAPEDIESYYFKLAVMMPFSTIPISKDLWINDSFFRVRTDLDTSQENIFTKAPFTYPPIANCKRNLRASPKNSSVFYCSNHLGTAILECKIKKLKVAYIGEWRLNLEKDILLMPYIGIDTPVGQSFPKYRSIIDNEIDILSKISNFDVSRQIKALVAFASDSFLWNTEYYTLSSWLSQYAFQMDQCQVICYPSFMTKKETLNFAFSTKIANRFSLETVYKIGTTEDHEIDNVAFELLEVGEKNTNSIVWRQRQKGDIIKLEKLLKLNH